MTDPRYAVSPEEKYYFDLRGDLIVRHALSAAEIAFMYGPGANAGTGKVALRMDADGTVRLDE